MAPHRNQEHSGKESMEVVLARMDGKLDELLKAKNHHEKRISWLERMIWMSLGGITLVTFYFNAIHK